MVKSSAQSDVVYWSYCSQTLPHAPPPPPKKNAQWGTELKKTLLFLLGKVKIKKYPEVEA